jgi:SAM-dependent methyltransferase
MATVVDQEFRAELSWEEKARRNPLFAVMSSPEFAEKSGDPGTWSPEDMQRFFDKGQMFYDSFFRTVLRRVPMEPGKATVVEYGCGMGRILKAVCNAGYECAGIDISPTMIEHCRTLVPEVGQLSTLDANGKSEIPSKSADFVFSYAVLQHISRLSLVDVAISEMCRIVKRGGFIKFQYRSLEKAFRQVVPKQEVPRKTWNYEDWSLQLHYQRLPIRGSRFLPRVPMLKVVRHDNWEGVPLAHRKMEAILNRNGITLTGIEEDPGHKRMYWATGRKAA